MRLPQSASDSCVRVRSGAPPPKVWLHSAKRLIARLRPLDGVGPCDGCEEHCEKLSFMAFSRARAAPGGTLVLAPAHVLRTVRRATSQRLSRLGDANSCSHSAWTAGVRDAMRAAAHRAMPAVVEPANWSEAANRESAAVRKRSLKGSCVPASQKN